MIIVLTLSKDSSSETSYTTHTTWLWGDEGGREEVEEGGQHSVQHARREGDAARIGGEGSRQKELARR